MTDLLILSATAGAGALVGGYIVCRINADRFEQAQHAATESWLKARHYRTAMQGYHDELTQAQNRIARALAQVTPGANSTVKRMERMLTGRQA